MVNLLKQGANSGCINNQELKTLRGISNFIVTAIIVCSLTACGADTSEGDLSDDTGLSETDSNTSDSNDIDSSDAAFEALNLPGNYFNYANITLPDYYTTNYLPDNFSFVRAAIEADNTPDHNPVTDAGATLGRVLFYDKKLSGNGTTACASCHLAEFGFSDPEVLSLGFEGRALDELGGTEDRTRRHSMGLANSRFFSGQQFFWDERAETLEDQVLMPFQDDVEMGLTLHELEQIVGEQLYYEPLFEAAFGSSEITTNKISLALAQFVRSMVSVTSAYDKARVDVDSPTENFPDFTTLQNEGKRLFFNGKEVNDAGERVNCQGCHTSEAFIAPILTDLAEGFTTATVNGLEEESVDDLGVGETTGRASDNGKFKVPSLKNIAVSAPYMHDGSLATLAEVMDFYSTGIQPHTNLDRVLVGSDGQALQFNFTDEEKSALIAFLETLTDTDMITDEKYSDPFK